MLYFDKQTLFNEKQAPKYNNHMLIGDMEEKLSFTSPTSIKVMSGHRKN